MDTPKPNPFQLNRGRVLILVLGAIVLVFAISMSMGGINSYQSLREANAAATQASPEQIDSATSAEGAVETAPAQ